MKTRGCERRPRDWEGKEDVLVYGLIQKVLFFIWYKHKCREGKMNTKEVTSSLESETLGVFHLQKISEIFFWEFPFGKSAFHFSQVPLWGGLAA